MPLASRIVTSACSIPHFPQDCYLARLLVKITIALFVYRACIYRASILSNHRQKQPGRLF
jgi:hypothetical protein